MKMKIVCELADELNRCILGDYLELLRFYMMTHDWIESVSHGMEIVNVQNGVDEPDEYTIPGVIIKSMSELQGGSNNSSASLEYVLNILRMLRATVGTVVSLPDNLSVDVGDTTEALLEANDAVDSDDILYKVADYFGLEVSGKVDLAELRGLRPSLENDDRVSLVFWANV